jgi:hypothetical protein
LVSVIAPKAGIHPMAENPERPNFELPNFNPKFCLKVTKSAASVCVGWLIIELLLLIVIGPSNKRCPGWMAYSENGAATSLWILVGVFTAGPAIYFCYVVRRWDRFCERLSDTMMGNRPVGLFRIRQDPANMFLIDTNKLCLRVTIGFCLLCAFPLWMIVTHCTDLPRYFGY